jgi:Heparinase II/III-like protein/Heparinase II/III N-terminus
MNYRLLRIPPLAAIALVSTLSLSKTHAQSAADPKPRLYLNQEDITRLREQAKIPELSAAYSHLEKKTAKNVSDWQKRNPATEKPRSTGELIAIGKRDNPNRDYKIVATAYALHPTPELGRILREKLLASVGQRRINNYWRNDGIHEGEAVMQYLEAYDIASGAGLLTAEDQAEIKEEMRRAGHYLEGWTLDNSFSQGYREYYRKVYCLNFHIFATSSMGAIAMLWPDLPESKEWLRQAQSALPTLLLTEYAPDGGYAEGSLHYWHCSYRALFEFMKASRNLGYRDYFADPAIADAMDRTLSWRRELTAPDGREFAVGDSDRETLGAEYLIEMGKTLNDPSSIKVGQEIIRRARPGMIPAEPYDLFQTDMAACGTDPDDLSVNFPFSGYGIFRSGWGTNENFFLMKYGPTFFGRRQNERNLVISGHAHADALEIELHHNGIPVTVDPGRQGRYGDWDTYGGYCKATIAHNTVGLGNKWGYDRLDGLYAEHVKKHGKEFLYEVSQDNIDPKDYELNAFGDVGQLGVISAKLHTYGKEQVTQRRTVVWFRDSGVAVVNDRMESPVEQPYEWYLNPVGNFLGKEKQTGALTFGDNVGKLQFIPITPKDETVQIVSKGDPKVPPYYVSLRPAGEDHQVKNAKHVYESKERWGLFTLLVLKKNAKSTDFLNVLVPYEGNAPYDSSALGTKGLKLTGKETTLLIAAGGNDDPALTVKGSFGVARLDHDVLVSYALDHGHELTLRNEPLLKVVLQSKDWDPFFDSTVTAAVSLKDRRASFSFPLSPTDRQLVMFTPKLEEGKEPLLPISVSVTFRTNDKPKRIIALRSDGEMPKLDDPAFDRKTDWQNDSHKGHYLREPLDFTWDEKTKCATVTMDVGIRQLVWE